MTARDILRRAARQGFGGAGIALASSFFALGALFGDSGLALWQSAFCTFIVFALPGQLAAAEMYALEAGVFIITISVMLVNMRLLPMTVALLPLLRHPSERGWRDFAMAHLIAATSWVLFMSTYRQIPFPARRRYFVYMGLILWACGIASTMLGWLIGGALPAWLLTGLLFLNPIYFLCMMLRALARRADAASMILGMLFLPLAHQWSGEWDIMASGIVGGTLAFMMFGREKGRQQREDI